VGAPQTAADEHDTIAAANKTRPFTAPPPLTYIGCRSTLGRYPHVQGYCLHSQLTREAHMSSVAALVLAPDAGAQRR
jgi:hypothetical protein